MHMPQQAERPVVRILHQMARSGGTVICKCLGSMSDVVLLSEIHPRGSRLFNPLRQAQQWFQLLTAADVERLRIAGAIAFGDAIALVYERCQERGKTLLLRDWSHLDFTAVPFLPAPSYRLTIAEVLGEQFEVRHMATVRHPLDQWLSLRNLALVHGKLSLEAFMRGYRRFAEHCTQIGFVRYEDFTRGPREALQLLCRELDLRYDPGWEQRWSSYTTITGEVQSRRAGTRIAPVPRQAMEAGLRETCEANTDYRESVRLLGYDQQDAAPGC
jgi:hypothetical protein